jgi:hypothetical protein
MIKTCLLLLLLHSTLLAANGFASESGPLLIRRNDLYGYADRSGREVIAPRYKQAQQFSEGLAAVEVAGRWGYIDAQGREVIPPQFAGADRFSEGLAAVEKDDKRGYINAKGAMVIPARFDRAKPFSQGLAIVKVGTELQVIDSSGKVVLTPEFDIVETFSEGLAAVKSRGRWGYMSTDGKLVVPLQFNSAGSFAQGLAPARKPDVGGGQVGYIDKSGAFVIAPRFREAKSFNENLAAVQVGDTWGYIDKEGNLKIRPKFFQAGTFSGGVAEVVDRLYGLPLYIDGAGDTIFGKSDVQESKSLGGYRLVSLEINSTPQGAKVYLIPRDDWDADNGIINQNDRLNAYRPKEGDTAPVTTRVYEQKLIIVYELNGKRSWKLVDVVGPNKNTVGITAP